MRVTEKVTVKSKMDIGFSLNRYYYQFYYPSGQVPIAKTYFLLSTAFFEI